MHIGLFWHAHWSLLTCTFVSQVSCGLVVKTHLLKSDWLVPQILLTSAITSLWRIYRVSFDVYMGLFWRIYRSLLTYIRVSFDLYMVLCDVHMGLFWRIYRPLLKCTRVSFDLARRVSWMLPSLVLCFVLVLLDRVEIVFLRHSRLPSARSFGILVFFLRHSRLLPSAFSSSYSHFPVENAEGTSEGTCVREPPSKNLVWILRGGSSYTRFLMREHIK